MKLKKLLITVLTLAMTVAVGIGFMGCDDGGTKDKEESGNPEKQILWIEDSRDFSTAGGDFWTTFPNANYGGGNSAGLFFKGTFNPQNMLPANYPFPNQIPAGGIVSATPATQTQAAFDYWTTEPDAAHPADFFQNGQRLVQDCLDEGGKLYAVYKTSVVNIVYPEHPEYPAIDVNGTNNRGRQFTVAKYDANVDITLDRVCNTSDIVLVVFDTHGNSIAKIGNGDFGPGPSYLLSPIPVGSQYNSPGPFERAVLNLQQVPAGTYVIIFYWNGAGDVINLYINIH